MVIHQLHVLHDRRKLHLLKNILLQINTGGDLLHLDALRRQRKDRALGDIQHRLLLGLGIGAGEGDLLDMGDKLFAAPLLLNGKSAVFDAYFKATGSKRTAVNDLALIL